MKLSKWARQNNLHYRTALKWFHAGTLPVDAKQMPSGTIWVNETMSLVQPTTTKVAIYARVSSHDQKSDLDRQVARITEWALDQKQAPTMIVKDIGSGLNNRRRGLLSLLGDPLVSTIIVEHKDRLARWGFEFIEATLKSRGAKILVVNPAEKEQDMVQDLIDVATSVCARVYGKRNAKNKAKKWGDQLTKL